MRQNWIFVSMVSSIAFALGATSTSHAATAQGPCEEITAACQGAGFVQGAAKTGNGLQLDCIVPIMQGAAPVPKGSKTLPQVDPQLVAACKARNPTFGQRRASSSTSDAPTLAVSPQPAASVQTTSSQVPSTLSRHPNIVFILTDENQEEIYRADVTRPQFQYPSDAPQLEPGKTYYWYVEPEPKAMDMARSEPAGFQVINGAELKEVEQKLAQIGASESFESGVARAQLFRDHGLWYDALSAYSELIEKNPDHAELYQQRAAIYVQLDPTKDLAERDLARAKEAGPAKQ